MVKRHCFFAFYRGPLCVLLHLRAAFLAGEDAGTAVNLGSAFGKNHQIKKFFCRKKQMLKRYFQYTLSHHEIFFVLVGCTAVWVEKFRLIYYNKKSSYVYTA